MGFKSSKPELTKTIHNFEKKELDEIDTFRSEMNTNDEFDCEKFNLVVFYGFKLKLIEWINQVYKLKGIKKTISNLKNKEDLQFLIYMLTNYNYNDEDNFFLYQRKNIIVLLYDMFTGKVSEYADSHNNESIKEPINLEIFKEIILYAYDIFKNFQSIKSQQLSDSNEKTDQKEPEKSKTNKDQSSDSKMLNRIENSLLSFTTKETKLEITMSDLISFCQNKLYNLDPYLRMFFVKLFLNSQNSFQTTFPTLVETPMFLTIEDYFCFCLANQHIMSRAFGFRLHECSTNGYNISTAINNIIGFTSPVTIFINTISKQTKKEVTLGLFMNSNFKECYGGHCGDDNSCIFAFTENKIELYKTRGGSNNYIYLINTKDKSNREKRLGIGFGKTYDGYKVWIDNADLFKESYFKMEDDVYQLGSPYDVFEEKLNVN